MFLLFSVQVSHTLTWNKCTARYVPRKIGFIFRELLFEVCNHSKPNVSSCMANEREPFYKEEKEDGGAIEPTKSTWLFISWVTARNPVESWEILLLVSQLYLIDSLRPRGLQHSRLPCLSPSPGAYTNSCPSS